MQDLADTPANTDLPSPDLALAIRDEVRRWYATYNKGGEDLNHTLMCAARYIAGAIAETPIVEDQIRAYRLFATICGLNIDLNNIDRYGVDPNGAVVTQAFH